MRPVTEGIDQRQAQRLQLDYDVAVDVGDESGATFYTGLLKDISTGGVFIATDKHHAVGEKLEVRFSFPGVDEPVSVTGTVRWCRHAYNAQDMNEGVGLQFDNLPDAVAATINHYLARADSLLFETTDEYASW